MSSQEKETATGESQDLIMFDHANNKIDRDCMCSWSCPDRKREVVGCMGSMVAIGCKSGVGCLSWPSSWQPSLPNPLLLHHGTSILDQV
jgi:hypothetical protein